MCDASQDALDFARARLSVGVVKRRLAPEYWKRLFHPRPGALR